MKLTSVGWRNTSLQATCYKELACLPKQKSEARTSIVSSIASMVLDELLHPAFGGHPALKLGP